MKSPRLAVALAVWSSWSVAAADVLFDPSLATVTFSVREFQPDIPYAGRFNAVAIDPSDSLHVLAASDSGGLFVSRDGGFTWRHERGLPVSLLKDLAFHPDDPRVVLATARADYQTEPGAGIWRSADGGATWSKPPDSDPALAGCLRGVEARGISIEPATGRVFVATGCGVTRSDDLGLTWDPHFVIPIGNDVHAVLALGDDEVVAAGPRGVTYSRDGGETWLRRTHPGAVMSPHALARIDTYRAGRLVYLVDQGPGGVRLWESSRPDSSWRQRSEAPAGDNRCGGIPFVRLRSLVGTAPIIISDFELFFGDGCQLYRASGSSQSPERPWLPSPPATLDAFSMADLDHADTRHLAFDATGLPAFLATDGGVHRPIDDDTWRLVGGGRGGLNALQLYTVNGQLIDSPPRYDVYFGTQDNDVWASADAGRTWPPAFSVKWEGWGIDLERRVARAVDSKVNFTACSPCVSWFSEALLQGRHDWKDPVADFQDRADPVRVGSGVQVQLGPAKTATGQPWSLYATPDHEVAWNRLVTLGADDAVIGLPRPSKLRVRGRSEPFTVVYQAFQGAFGNLRLARVSDVLGAPFLSSACGSGPPPPEGEAGACYPAMTGFDSLGAAATAWYSTPVFAVDPQDPSHLIAADAGRSSGMKRSQDGGETWAPITALTDLMLDGGRLRFTVGNPFGPTLTLATSISFCPDDPNLVLVGTTQAGVFFSKDRGVSWQKVPGSEPIVYVSDFHWQSASSVLVSTYGRGLWKINVNLRFPSLFLDGACVKPCTVETLGQPQPGRPDRAFLVLRGRVTDAESSGGRLTRLATTPGSATVVLGDDEPPPVPLEESFEMGAFKGLEDVTEFTNQGKAIAGFALTAGVVTGVFVSDTPLEIAEPGAFLTFQDLGRRTSGREKLPAIRLGSADSLGGLPVLGDSSTLRVAGSRFRPGALRVFVDGVSQKLRARADKKGSFSFSLPVRASRLSQGLHEVRVVQKTRRHTIDDVAYFLIRHREGAADAVQPKLRAGR